MSQVWLITGSSRGLGRAFAEAALGSGLQVAATARNTEDLAELKDKYGDLVLPLSLDVTGETQASEAVAATIRTFGNSMFWSITPVSVSGDPSPRWRLRDIWTCSKPTSRRWCN